MSQEKFVSPHGPHLEADRRVGYFLVIVGLLAIAGWYGDFSLLRSWLPGLPEMRLNNSVTVILLGLTLIGHLHFAEHRALHLTLLTFLFTNGCVGILEPLLPMSLSGKMLAASGTTGVEDGTFIFSSSGFNFLLLSFVVLLYQEEACNQRRVAQIVNGVILFISCVTVIGYIYEDPGLCTLTHSQGMSLPTAFSFFIVSLIIALHETEIGLGKLFSTDLMGSSLARIIFPATVGSAMVLGYVFMYATKNEWFKPETTMTTVVVIFVVACVIITWYIVKITNELDLKKQIARDQLKELKDTLQAEVKARTAELALVKQRLELAAQAGEISIWEWDIATNTFTGNDLFTKIANKPGATFVTADEMAAALHPDDKELARVSFQTAIEEKSAVDFVHRIVNLKGEIRYVRVKGFAVYDEQNIPKKMYGVHWDVTEQKASEYKITEQAKNLEIISNRLTTATKGAKIGIWDMDLTTQEIIWNDQMYEIYDLSPSEFKGGYESWYDRVHPEDYAALESMADVISKGDDFDVKFRIYHKDGSLHTLKSCGFMQRNEKGEVYRMIGTNIDITKEMEAQKELQEQYDLNMKFVAETPSSIAMFDCDMNYLAASTQWKDEFGLDAKEIIGVNHYELFPHITEDRKEYHRNALNGSVCSSEAECFTLADGTTRWFKWEMKPWYKTATAIGGVVMHVIDITQRFEQEEAIKRSKGDLEKLSGRLLRQNKLLGDFAHITSHNLRAPIGNLNTLHNFYLEANTTEERELIYSKIGNVIEHVTLTLNELITALKIKEDVDCQMQMLHFEDSFNVIKKRLALKIEGANITMESDFSDSRTVLFNKAYLENIFLNLMSNAIKYRSSDRDATIAVWTAREKDGSTTLRVKDNGMGIDLDKHRHKLFGLHKTFHRHPESHGVGLFLTKTQVEALGGEIWVESVPGEGSTFIVKFNAEL